MKKEQLYEALGEINEDYINDAHQTAKKKSHPVWMKWGSMVACLCLIITASIMIFPSVLNTKVENADIISIQGTTVESSMGKIVLTDSNLKDSTCTFTLTKNNDKPIYFCFRGFTVLNTHIDEDGTQRKEVQQYHVITPYDNYNEAATNHIVIDNKLSITVNGETVDVIPTAQGTYEITIDYSALYEFLDYVEPAVNVYSFGSFVIDSDLNNTEK